MDVLQLSVIFVRTAVESGTESDESSWPALRNHVRRAQKEEDEKAKKMQSSRNWIARGLVWLGPLAVAVLALDITFSPDNRFELWLWFIEFAILITMLVLTARGLGKKTHEEWVMTRLRAELLRREEYLFRTRLGPYLSDASREWVHQRVSGIQTSDELLRFTAMQGERRANWHDELADACFENSQAVVTIEPGFVESYLDERLDDQIKYFEGRKSFSRIQEWRFELILQLALIAALVLSVLRMIPDHGEPLYRTISLVGLCLPALCSGIVAWHAAFEYRRNHRASEQKLIELRQLKSDLEALHKENAEKTAGGVLRIKRKVLDTEAVLSQELYEWWLIIDAAEPKAGM